jgi:hypothetical protein
MRSTHLLCLLVCGAASLFSAPVPVPVVAGVSPNNVPAAGGGAVSISGSGFAEGSSVYFGSVRARAVHVLSPMSIVAVSPAGAGAADVRVEAESGISASTPYDRVAYDPSPSGPWLGLNGNSVTYLGPVKLFARRRVLFDRIELTAGQLQGSRAPLRRSIGAGMIPDVAIEYGGYTGDRWGTPDPRFPHGRGIARYVDGFLQTALSIRRAYPHARVLFEPINEPYGYATAAQYAAVIAALLPAAARAGLPLPQIYVAAWGKDWVPSMYEAQPSLRTLIEGWYFHPYGPPSGAANGDSAGIQSVPAVQAQMTSGQSNIIISEIGWCALDVRQGEGCSTPYVDTGRQAAADLSQALQNALPMRSAGWLRALLVFSRNYGGWAMQLPGGGLTEEGKTLLRFAAEHAEG